MGVSLKPDHVCRYRDIVTTFKVEMIDEGAVIEGLQKVAAAAGAVGLAFTIIAHDRVHHPRA